LKPERFVLAETKHFQNWFETVFFQFHFVVRTVLEGVLSGWLIFRVAIYPGEEFVRLPDHG